MGVSVERVSSDEGIWWTIPDGVAATIHDGRPPGQVERPVVFRPRGTQPGLRSVRLRGEIDPRLVPFSAGSTLAGSGRASCTHA